MEMSDNKSFRDSFIKKVDEMEELIKGASKEDLDIAGIPSVPANEKPPKINPEPKTEKEFIKGLLIYCTGSANTYILQKADQASNLDIKDLTQNKFSKVIVPSIIKPNGSTCTFRPYITFFTPDGKMACFPYDGHEFPDTHTPVGSFMKRGFME